MAKQVRIPLDEIIKAATQAALAVSGQKISEEMRQIIDSNESVATHRLIDSVDYAMEGRPAKAKGAAKQDDMIETPKSTENVLRMDVGTAVPYAEDVELGLQDYEVLNSQDPITLRRNIVTWMNAKGIEPRYGTIMEYAERIANKIIEHGVDAAPFLAPTVPIAEKVLESALRNAYSKQKRLPDIVIKSR